MRKWICMMTAVLLIASLAACGNKQETKNEGNKPSQQTEQNNAGQGQNADSAATQQSTRVEQYAEHDVSFTVPDEWQQNFRAFYYEHGSGDTAFSTIEFTCRMGQNDVNVMTIAAFGDKQWESIKKATPEAEKMKLGTSKDGKTTYTLRIEEQKFENDADQKTFNTIRDAAKTLEGKIKITK